MKAGEKSLKELETGWATIITWRFSKRTLTAHPLVVRPDRGHRTVPGLVAKYQKELLAVRCRSAAIVYRSAPGISRAHAASVGKLAEPAKTPQGSRKTAPGRAGLTLPAHLGLLRPLRPFCPSRISWLLLALSPSLWETRLYVPSAAMRRAFTLSAR